MKNIKVKNNPALAASMKNHFGYWTEDSIINGFVTFSKNSDKDDFGLVPAICSFYSNMGTFRLEVKITETDKELFTGHVLDNNKIALT